MRAFFLSVLVCLSAQGQLATMPGGGTMWTISSGVSAPDILWWKGDPGTGTTQTGTVGPNGTLSNSAIWTNSFTPGGSSTDWYFPDSSFYHIDSALAVDFTTNKITVEFRIYAASYANALNRQFYVHNKAADVLNVWSISNDTDAGTGAIILNIFDNGVNEGRWTIARPSTSTWHHIAVAFDDSAKNNPVAYVDGSSVTVTLVSDVRSSFANFKTNNVYINSNNSGGGTAIPGIAMKDVRIYSGLRSAGNIATDATSYP